jgi:hypothetical protein
MRLMRALIGFFTMRSVFRTLRARSSSMPDDFTADIMQKRRSVSSTTWIATYLCWRECSRSACAGIAPWATLVAPVVTLHNLCLL